MVGASLLAEIDMKLRDVIVDVNSRKRSRKGHAHPFGGLNVLLSGDLWQLPPPSDMISNGRLRCKVNFEEKFLLCF